MGKEIIFPFTCETSNKIKNGFKWMILLSLTFGTIIVIWNFTNPNILFQISSVLVVIFTPVAWMFQVLAWDQQGKLPHFKCKPKPFGESVK